MLKKSLKWGTRLLLLFLLYVIAGALLPFAFPKETGEEFKADFHPETFYSDTVGNDRARVVETPLDALDTRIQMIHQAEERVILSTFDIREGESARDIFACLLEAADRGVKVQVLVDGLYGSIHMNGNPVFYAAGTHPGIEIKFYNIPNPLAPWTINDRMHDKYLIIDEKLLLLGGRNTFDYFLGEYNEKKLSYDRDVLIYNTKFDDPAFYEGSVISQADHYFQDIWALDCCKSVFDAPPGSMEDKLSAARQELADRSMRIAAEKAELTAPGHDYEPETVAINKATLISNPTHIYGKEPWVWYQSQYLMAHAQNRAYIHTPYAVLSKDMYQGIREIMANVPDVTMMLNATSVGDNFMASSDYTHNGGKILDTGADVYEYFGDHSSHGKSILIDDRLSLVGSYNLDMRSTYVDTETVLVIDGKEFNRQLESCILDLEADALKVNKDGTYEPKPGVPVIGVPAKKKAIFAVTSRLFQLFRYLI